MLVATAACSSATPGSSMLPAPSVHGVLLIEDETVYEGNFGSQLSWLAFEPLQEPSCTPARTLSLTSERVDVHGKAPRVVEEGTVTTDLPLPPYYDHIPFLVVKDWPFPGTNRALAGGTATWSSEGALLAVSIEGANLCAFDDAYEGTDSASCAPVGTVGLSLDTLLDDPSRCVCAGPSTDGTYGDLCTEHLQDTSASVDCATGERTPCAADSCPDLTAEPACY